MVNYFYLFAVKIILLADLVKSNINYTQKINLFFLKEKQAFYETDLKIEILNIDNKQLKIDSLPSDLVHNLRKNKITETLEISLNQGQLEILNKKSFIEYKNYNKKTRRNNNIRLKGTTGYFDYFFDSVGTNLIFSNKLVNSRQNQENFHNLLDSFAENFKIPKF